MSGDLTVALIKNQSGQYDLELVRRLVVSNMRVGKITNLDRCVNLTTLNLSSNRIMNIDGLDNCVKLTRLDLSKNSIRKVDLGLGKLRALEHLDLSGNSISGAKQLAKDLEPCASIRILSLQSLEGTAKNSCCDENDYAALICVALPALEVLDGGRLALEKEVDAIKSLLDDAGAEDNAKPTVLEQWITRDFDWQSKDGKVTAPLKAAYSQRDLNVELNANATQQVKTDLRHLTEDIDREVEKSNKLLAELFPEDSDPLGLGHNDAYRGHMHGRRGKTRTADTAP